MKVLQSNRRPFLGVAVLSGCAFLAWACSTYTSNTGDNADSGEPSLDGAKDGCDSPRTKCGAACVDTNNDDDNCGACGNACVPGHRCTAGKCELACPTGLSACKALAPATDVDAGGDGSVGPAIDATTDPVPVDIDAGPTGPYCAKLTDDPANCGSCGNRCTTAQICTSGTCCKPGQEACGGVCTVLASDANNCGACGKACTGATPSCNSGVCISRYTASGVQQNVPVATAIAGWTQCFKEEYGQSTLLVNIKAACSKAHVMMACRPVGVSELQLLAQAPRADVFFDTGDGNTAKHEANGVAWYWSNDASFGFAPGGLTVDRNNCDYIDSYAGSPQLGTGQGDKRMCTHTGGGFSQGGWRCGRDNSLGAGWERILYHAD